MSQRVPCPPRHPARPPASSARPNPARRGFCPPRRPARASASTAQSYPCLTPAFSCAPPPAFPMRPIPAPARVIRTALSLRAAGSCPPPVFACAPREGRILEVSQRVPCPPRRPAPARVPCAAYPCLPPVFSCALPPASPARPNPARRRSRHPHSPIPPCRRFCPSASPCARVRIHCAVLSLPAAGFFLRSAARVPCAAYPCLTPVLCAASPCARRFFPASRGKGGYWQ